MEISFYSGCTSRNLKIKDLTKGIEVFLDSYPDETDHSWETHLPLLKQVLIEMVNELKFRGNLGLNTIYRYFVESDYKEINYDQEVQESSEEVYQRITQYISNLKLGEDSSIHTLIEVSENLIAIMADLQGYQGKSHSCDQCGDTNYGYKAHL